MKETLTCIAKIVAWFSGRFAGDQKTFSANAADLMPQVEMQIQGVKKEVEALNERFLEERVAKQLRVTHRLVFAEKRTPAVVWIRIHSWGERPVQVSAITLKSNHLFYGLEGELKDVLASHEAVVIGVRIRLARLIALKKALSEVIQ